MTTSDWTLDSVPRLARVTAVAEGALDAAKSHADARVVAAERNLVLKLSFLAIGLGFGVAGFWFVSRRVMRPLRVIQTAMLKVADGELAMEVPYADRGDEIGALAQALIKFKENAGEKTRIESEQQRRADAGHAAPADDRRAYRGIRKPCRRGSPGAELRVGRHAGDIGKAHRNRRADQPAGQERRRIIRQRVEQRADRRGGVTGAHRLDRRDRPAGHPCGQHRGPRRDRDDSRPTRP